MQRIFDRLRLIRKYDRKTKKNLMKKLVLILFVLPMLFAGCSDDNKGGVSLDKYRVEFKTGDTKQVHVTAGDPNSVIWRSDNEYIATVEKGRITGHRIGSTFVFANTTIVAVVVNGRYNLYDEPTSKVRWGMTKDEVTRQMGFPDKVDNNVITYNLNSSVNSFESYEFDANNRLCVANITVSREKTSQLDDFLAERYLLLSSSVENENQDYINGLTTGTSTMTVRRAVYDEAYWIVSYRGL